MKKPRLLHVIDSLAIGGAEINLKNTVNTLTEYEHIVVFLKMPDTIQRQFSEGTHCISLNYTGWKSILSSIKNLRRLILSYKPIVVHSHLFQSTLIARMAKPKTVPLVTTLHSIYSIDAFSKNKLSFYAEQLTSCRTNALIGVSDCVMKDYLSFIPYKGKKYVLYNFLPDTFFTLRNVKRHRNDSIKLVAVGNLNESKNYGYLIFILNTIKKKEIHLDIYGEVRTGYKNLDIKANNLTINFKGVIEDIVDVLPNYDLFIQSSSYEGFGISVIEAMAVKVPVFISDIPVFKEVTGGHAHFFTLTNPNEAASKLNFLVESIEEREKFVEEAWKFVFNNYRKEVFIKRLRYIYNDITGNSF